MASPVQMVLSAPGTVECDPESTHTHTSQSGALRSPQFTHHGPVAESEVLVPGQLWLLCLLQRTPFSVPERRPTALPWAWCGKYHSGNEVAHTSEIPA